MEDDDEEDADADQQGIWPIEVSGKATRDARTVHRTTHQTEFELDLSGTASGQSIWPPWPDYTDDDIVLAGESADIPVRTGIVPLYLGHALANLVSSRHIMLLDHPQRELPLIPLKQAVAHQLMSDLAAGAILHTDAALVHADLVQPPELVDTSDDDDMPRADPLAQTG